MGGRTSGTRPKGSGIPASGAGWGGSAKGEGSRVPGPGRGHTHRTVADLMAQAGAREVAAERWMAILNDPEHPKHADMVAKAAERLDGAPEQRITNDVTTRYVVRAPAKAADVDEWAKQHKPSGL